MFFFSFLTCVQPGFHPSTTVWWPCWIHLRMHSLFAFLVTFFSRKRILHAPIISSQHPRTLRAYSWLNIPWKKVIFYRFALMYRDFKLGIYYNNLYCRAYLSFTVRLSVTDDQLYVDLIITACTIDLTYRPKYLYGCIHFFLTRIIL